MSARKTKCPACQGTGGKDGKTSWLDDYPPCPKCEGTGRIFVARRTDAKPRSSAARGSAPTDTVRLEWLAKHEAMICRGKRVKSRRAGLVAENMEDVWTVEWEKGNGDLVGQTVDGGHADFRDAIDAAMKAQNAELSDADPSGGATETKL